MNKFVLTFLSLWIVGTAMLYAQTSSRALRFQAFAYGPDSLPIKNEAVTVRFTLYPKTGSGFTFSESQDVTTDPFGVFYCNVGSKNTTDYQKLGLAGDYWMKIEVKKKAGGVFTTISDEAFAAVPYAKQADNGVPVGTIIPFGGQLDKIPDGWLLCDGTQYDGADPRYEQLFNVIGNAWGGDGNAFNVPKLNGVFLRGLDSGEGNDPNAANRIAIQTGGNTGDKVGSYQADMLGAHNHNLSFTTSTDGAHTHGFPETVLNFQGGTTKNTNGGDGEGRPINGTNSGGSHSHNISGTTENNTQLETRPENVFVAYIIKY